MERKCIIHRVKEKFRRIHSGSIKRLKDMEKFREVLEREGYTEYLSTDAVRDLDKDIYNLKEFLKERFLEMLISEIIEGDTDG